MAALAAALLAPPGRSAEYVLGPDDILQLKVTRHPEMDTEGVVLPDGTFAVPRVGTVSVQGLTLSQAQAEVVKALSKVLVSPQVSLSVKSARPTKVHVLGQVSRPGPFDLKPGWRITDLLAEAGGLRPNARPEDLSATLFHRDGTTERIDLAGVLLRQEASANVELRPGDLLDIRSTPTTPIFVRGQAVRLPGPMEVPEGQGVLEVLAMAGGLTVKPERARLTLIHQDGSSENIDLTALQSDPRARVVFRPQDILDVQEAPVTRIFLSGLGVRNPGLLEITEGMGIVEALTLAGGTTPTAALRRAVLIRPERSAQAPIEIPLDPRVLSAAGGASPLRLEEGDSLVVRRLRPGQPPEDVPVQVPEGQGDGKLQVSLGPGDRLILRRARPARPRQEIPLDLYGALVKGTPPPDVRLESGDTLVIPERSERIYVFGLVRTPGAMPLPESENFGVADAILLAGGSAPRAALSKVTVVRRNAEAGEPQILKADIQSYLKKGLVAENIPLRDGDTVIVPETGKPDVFGRVIPGLTSLLALPYYLFRFW